MVLFTRPLGSFGGCLALDPSYTKKKKETSVFQPPLNPSACSTEVERGKAYCSSTLKKGMLRCRKETEGKRRWS